MYRRAIEKLESWKAKETRKPLLLGVSIHEGVSYPVGKVELLDLNPLMYREFLCAMAEQYVLQQIIADTEYTPYYFGTERAVRFSTKKYVKQEWMENVPLYAVCNL